MRALLSDLAGLQRAVGFRAQEGRLSCVTGIGSRAWDRLFAGPRPAELHPFRELAGPVHRGRWLTTRAGARRVPMAPGADASSRRRQAPSDWGVSSCMAVTARRAAGTP